MFLIPHSSFLIPHSSFLIPQSPFHSPQSSVHSPQSTVHSPRSSVLSPQSSVLSLYNLWNQKNPQKLTKSSLAANQLTTTCATLTFKICPWYITTCKISHHIFLWQSHLSHLPIMHHILWFTSFNIAIAYHVFFGDNVTYHICPQCIILCDSQVQISHFTYLFVILSPIKSTHILWFTSSYFTYYIYLCDNVRSAHDASHILTTNITHLTSAVIIMW